MVAMPSETRAAASTRARLFLALWPDAAVREQLLRLQAAWPWPPGAALTPPERLHLTLHFIGDVERGRIPELAAGLQAVVVEPVQCLLDHAELWPGGVAVLGARAVPAPLARLQRTLRETAERVLGVAGERRRFRPHVTLARKAQRMAVPGMPLAVAWTAARCALVESVRDGATHGYRSLQVYAA